MVCELHRCFNNEYRTRLEYSWKFGKIACSTSHNSSKITECTNKFV